MIGYSDYKEPCPGQGCDHTKCIHQRQQDARIEALESAIHCWVRAHDGFRSGRAPVHLLHAAEAALLDVARGEA